MSVIYQWGNLSFSENQLNSSNQMKVFEVQQEIQSICCGFAHFILKTQNGMLGCGNNQYGQLGIDGPYQIQQIVQIPLNIKNSVKEISCGWFHTLVLDHQGTVFSSGEGINGVLGYGRGQNSYQFKPVIHNIFQISAGKTHSLALSKTMVYGWGNSKNSQLGLIKQKIYYEPQQLLVYQSYYCYAGDNYSFFATDRGVFSTGSNENGQLGQGHQKKVTMAKKVKLQGKVHKIEGKKYVMIQLTTGEIYLCGSGSFGKFLLPTKMQFFKNLSHFCLGEDLGIVKNQDNKIYVFGANHYGKLALNYNEQIKYPRENQILTNLKMNYFENGQKFMLGFSLKNEGIKMQRGKKRRKEMIKSSINMVNPEKNQKRKHSQEINFYERQQLKTENYNQDIKDQSEKQYLFLHTPVFERKFDFSERKINEEFQKENNVEMKEEGERGDSELYARIANLQNQNKKQQMYINTLRKQYLTLTNIIESDSLLKKILETKRKDCYVKLQENDNGQQFQFQANQLRKIVNDLAQ